MMPGHTTNSSTSSQVHISYKVQAHWIWRGWGDNMDKEVLVLAF